MNKLISTVLALTSMACLAPAAQAQSASAGEKKAAMCIGCHGIPGYQASFPEIYKVPKIAGQNAKYIASALTAYGKGTRKHPTMTGIAVSLSEQDIADLAAYYEQLGKKEAQQVAPKPAQAPSAQVAALLQKGNCLACHGENFSQPIDPSYPKLGGQHADYLYAALKAYQTQGNPHVGRADPIMGGMAKPFSISELKLMARYIGSLPGELSTIPQPRFK